MPALADRRFSIRAEDLVDTENPRELPGNRHQQDAEHVQHLRDYGGANSRAGRLLKRDGHQPAPTSRRNLSEDGVPGVLLEPDQPSGTSSNRLRPYPEMKINKKRVKELAHWAPASGPHEPGAVTMDAPAHQVIANTSGDDTRALEVQEKTGSNDQEPIGNVELGITAAAPPPATSSGEIQGRLSLQPC